MVVNTLPAGHRGGLAEASGAKRARAAVGAARAASLARAVEAAAVGSALAVELTERWLDVGRLATTRHAAEIRAAVGVGHARRAAGGAGASTVRASSRAAARRAAVPGSSARCAAARGRCARRAAARCRSASAARHAAVGARMAARRRAGRAGRCSGRTWRARGSARDTAPITHDFAKAVGKTDRAGVAIAVGVAKRRGTGVPPAVPVPAIVVSVPDARSEDAPRQSHEPKKGTAVHRNTPFFRKGAITLRTARAIITRGMRTSIAIDIVLRCSFIDIRTPKAISASRWGEGFRDNAVRKRCATCLFRYTGTGAPLGTARVRRLTDVFGRRDHRGNVRNGVH